MNYAQLEARIAVWAQGQADLRAVVVVGSRAGGDHAPNEWSDLDLVLFTLQANFYASQADWVEAIGETWLAVPSTTGRGDPVSNQAEDLIRKWMVDLHPSR